MQVKITASGVAVLRYGKRARSGRHILVVAGQHGNECEPVWAVQTAVRDGAFERVREGIVTVVPQANPWGLCVGVRYRSDGEDPNRLWGTRDTATREVWAAICESGLPSIVLDLHTCDGGPSFANASGLGRLRRDAELRSLVGEPESHLGFAGSLESYCESYGVAAYTMEFQRGIDAHWLSRVFVHRLLDWL